MYEVWCRLLRSFFFYSMDTQTHEVTDASDHSTHASATASVVNEVRRDDE